MPAALARASHPPRSSRALAVRALQRWRAGNGFADALMHDLLREASLAASDRAFAVELFYGVLRHLRLLDFWIAQLRAAPVDDDTRDLLRLGLYQIFLLSTPAHAAVHATVELAGARARPLINGILRSALRRHDELAAAAEQQTMAIRYSHPDFLVEKWAAQFGAEPTEQLCRWNNQPAPVYARVNELRISPAEFAARNPDARDVPERPNFFQLHGSPAEIIQRGEGYAQDPSTALACELLDPQPGDSVLDACAAPGGKSGYLAQRMRNDGRLFACDQDAHRLPLLRENLERLGVRIAQVQQCDWLAGTTAVRAALDVAGAPPAFDRILVDAPCSNTGVMRRRVDVRWRLRAEDFSRMQAQQLGIMRTVLPLLRPGGVLVYSTCSLEPEENENVVAALLREFPGAKLIAQNTVLPFRDDFDGAFAAKLVR